MNGPYTSWFLSYEVSTGKKNEKMTISVVNFITQEHRQISKIATLFFQAMIQGTTVPNLKAEELPVFCCETMLTTSNKNIEKCKRKSRKGPILVLS